MYLSNLMLTVSSNLYYNLGFMIVKRVESGLLNFSINTYTSSSFVRIASTLIDAAILHPMKIVLFRRFFVFLLLLL